MKGKYLDMRRATQKTHAALIGNLTTTATSSDGEVSEWSSRLQQTRGSDNFFFFPCFFLFFRSRLRIISTSLGLRFPAPAVSLSDRTRGPGECVQRTPVSSTTTCRKVGFSLRSDCNSNRCRALRPGRKVTV